MASFGLPSQKATTLVRHGLSLVKLCWLSQIINLSCTCYFIVILTLPRLAIAVMETNMEGALYKNNLDLQHHSCDFQKIILNPSWRRFYYHLALKSNAMRKCQIILNDFLFTYAEQQCWKRKVNAIRMPVAGNPGAQLLSCQMFPLNSEGIGHGLSLQNRAQVIVLYSDMSR